MKINFETYPKDITLDNGRFVFEKLLGGRPREGRWRGVQLRPKRRNVLISFFATNYPDSATLDYQYDCPGLAPVLFAGYPDVAPARDSGRSAYVEHALVEAMPDGADLTKSGRLGPHETVRLGLGLCETILAWDARTGIHCGLRPETVYVTGGPGQRRFSGATPRSFRLLGNDGMYAPFSWDGYDPPTADHFMDIDVDEEVFVVGLLMWYALLGEHAFDVPGHPGHADQANNMWDDIRLPFRGPPELGWLLDGVLVADIERRMTAVRLRHELTKLARAWRVDVPPFPPPGLNAR